MEKIKIDKITTKQKKKFFEFCFKNFTKKLTPFGFCALFSDFFYFEEIDYNNNINLLPELIKFKPKKYFYDCDNEKTDDKSLFWFPIGEDQSQSKRIEICKKILAKLK